MHSILSITSRKLGQRAALCFWKILPWISLWDFLFFIFFIFQAVLQKLPQVLIIANLSCILIGSWTVITAKTHIGNEEQRRAQSSCWVNKVESAVQRIGHKNHAITAATLITFTARDLRGPLHSMGVVRSGTAWKLDSAQAPAKAYE